MISLQSAKRFHGHLGPWLVLGLLMGEYGLKKIRAKKYFGLELRVSGLNKKPRSCLIDGLQLSTGCTLGKGNIKVNGAKKIKVTFINRENKNNISLGLRNGLLKKVDKRMSHKEAEAIAGLLFKADSLKLFNLIKS